MNRLMMAVLLVVALPVQAFEGDTDSVKDVSGMSIMGNNETPKSLYIVPWKASEIASETEFSSTLLDESMVPVDKPVFMRELGFYKISSAEQKK